MMAGNAIPARWRRKPMWSRATLLDLQESMALSQVSWAGTAKAISIIPLVFWTNVGDRLYLNEMLIFVRMPLFFFIFGFFAYRVVPRPGLATFLRNKIGNLLYLHALWIGLLVLGTGLVARWRGSSCSCEVGEPMRCARASGVLWRNDLWTG
jgi:hypothetical protein